MKRILLTITLVLCFFAAPAQIVINELDSDTPGTDTREFIELKTTAPNTSLNGYVLVFFNGNATSSTANKSYYALSLNGLTSDANGLVLIGNSDVAPVPAKVLANSSIQNGPDAVAVYQGVFADYPMGTLATTSNLICALGHGILTDNSMPELLQLLGNPPYFNEGATAALSQNQSIQRKPDGSYEAKTPTPGANNDGSGVQYNPITISVPSLEYTEGMVLPITFSTGNPVAGSTLNFSFTLHSGSFTTADFTGNTSVSIPVGSTSFTTNITLVDDALDEGDELLKINIGTIPAGYTRMNDNLEVRIIDNDFTVAAWGTPLNPTYGVVTRNVPAEYYATLEGKSGAVLKQAIQDIIANSEMVRAQNYGDVTDILKQADQNPANSNQVWLMYVEQGRSKYKFQTTSSNVGSWNREHIFPQSRGGFADGTSSTPDGINVWLPTNADDINAGHGDAHHIRAEDGPENSARNNRDYGLDYNGPAGNAGSWHGDVARSLFYMACRYNALSLVNGNPTPDDASSSKFILGDLATLLAWNLSDPSDDFEMNRNNVIFNWQKNRNPFIDYPELANYIWGPQVNTPWFAPLSTTNIEELKFRLYPNPASDRIVISGLSEPAQVLIYNLAGGVLYNAKISGDSPIKLDLASGIYLVKVSSQHKSAVKKLIIK